MPLCINCRHYRPGKTEAEDTCLHPKASRGGVRSEIFFSCNSMISGLCEKNKLFEPATLPQMIHEVTK